MRMTRRHLLKSATALAGAAFSTRVVSAAPAAEAVTPALIEAAQKEGKLAFYTAMDLPVAEKFAQAFPDSVSALNVARALASYLRALRSGDAPVDRFLRGERSALSAEAEAGMRLFNGKASRKLKSPTFSG